MPGRSRLAGRGFTPRYHEIEQALRAQIAELEPHDPLPSEAALCERFGVSRMTARAAMTRLTHDGLVYRQPGRGTFVARRPPIHRQLSSLYSFTDEMYRRGREPSSRLVKAGTRAATAAQAAALAREPGAEIVYVHRVRLADEEPMAVELAVFPGACRSILEEDLARRSLHEVLVEHGWRPTKGRSQVVAAAARATDVQFLGVAPRSPLLVERRVITGLNGRPLEYTESRYVGDRYVLDTEFTVRR